jgi:GalNAc-alpha-(1->4)-GalNAc-alpha-(1->3)-diNAcBac-PP-undecaprenol alpha-1,4-N-acetyl-D-galactosaminyltransferase
MRILFVVPGMGYGGAERVISILANSFVIKGYDVKILIMNTDGESVYKLNENIEVEVIPPANRKKVMTVFRLLKSIRNITRKFTPDVIISFMNDTCAITAIANFGRYYPIVYSERNDPSNTNRSIKDRLLKFIVEQRVNGFVFQSTGAKELYSKKVQKKSTVILNPLNLKKLPPYFIGERKKEIVSVGRLHPQKNHQMLIRAFSHIATDYPKYKLRIYGEGTLRNNLQKQIDDLGLCDRVMLMGNVPNVMEEINNASIFAFSSDYEGLPNALIEAMALGLPCISTDFTPGGASMLIVNFKNGVLAPIGDDKKFAEGLSYLLSNKEKAIEMGSRAQKIVERVNEENIIAEWEKFISTVLKENIRR